MIPGRGRREDCKHRKARMCAVRLFPRNDREATRLVIPRLYDCLDNISTIKHQQTRKGGHGKSQGFCLFGFYSTKTQRGEKVTDRLHPWLWHPHIWRINPHSSIKDRRQMLGLRKQVSRRPWARQGMRRRIWGCFSCSFVQCR